MISGLHRRHTCHGEPLPQATCPTLPLLSPCAFLQMPCPNPEERYSIRYTSGLHLTHKLFLVHL